MNSTNYMTLLLQDYSAATLNSTFLDGQQEGISAYQAIASVVCVLSIIANICVLMVFICGPLAFRTSFFFAIANLACASLLCGVSVMCVILINVSNGDSLRKSFACKSLVVLSFVVSISSLVFLSIERHFKLFYEGFYSKLFTSKNCLIAIGLIWGFSFVAFCLIPFPFGLILCEPILLNCTKNMTCRSEYCSKSLIPSTKSYLVACCAIFYLGVGAMLLQNLRLIGKVYHDSGRSLLRGNLSFSRSIPNYGPFVMIHRKKELELAKTLRLVIVAFFICWLPVTILFMVDLTGDNDDLEKWLNYCLSSVILHQLINPIIYSRKLPRMWNTFRRMIYAVRRRLQCHEVCLSKQQKLLSCQKDASASIPNFSVIETSVSEESKFSNESHRGKLLKSSHNHANKQTPIWSILPVNKKSEHEVDGANSALTLPHGTVVDRNLVKISAPFNPEIKLMW